MKKEKTSLENDSKHALEKMKNHELAQELRHLYLEPQFTASIVNEAPNSVNDPTRVNCILVKKPVIKIFFYLMSQNLPNVSQTSSLVKQKSPHISRSLLLHQDMAGN